MTECGHTPPHSATRRHTCYSPPNSSHSTTLHHTPPHSTTLRHCPPVASVTECYEFGRMWRCERCVVWCDEYGECGGIWRVWQSVAIIWWWNVYQTGYKTCSFHLPREKGYLMTRVLIDVSYPSLYWDPAKHILHYHTTVCVPLCLVFLF